MIKESNTPKEALDRINICNTTKSTELDLSGLGLIKIPNEISKLSWIVKLSLNNNKIKKIENLDNMPFLSRLNLASNQIKTIEGLDYVINLTNLILSSNLISQIEGLEKLLDLKQLDISYNRLTSINGLENLENLEYLYLQDNKLAQIEDFKELNNLIYLSIINNKIKDLTPLLFYAKKGMIISSHYSYYLKSGIHVSGNPIIIPDIETVKRGNEAILQYFENIQNEKHQLENIYEGKLLIVGEGGAGKTSFLRKLLDENAVLPTEEETTRGIDIQHYEFKAADGRTFRLHLWDFGGQEIYHATHQFFLTKRSLYCLVDDTRKDDKNVNDPTFNYWLQTAKLYGDSSPMLIVQNEKGNRSKQLELGSMKARYGFIKDSFATNLEDCRGLATLKAEIERLAQQLPHSQLLFPRDELQVRNDLENLAKTENHISLEKYIEICEKQGVTEKRGLFLLQRLHDLGVILYFENEPLLQNIIILKNAWATKAVYSLLDEENIKKKFGFFTEEDLVNVWSEDEYKRKRHELLAMMIEFQLCYLLPDMTKKTWLAPQLLNAERPANFTWNESENLGLRYQYEFMPKGLLSRFVVRMHRYVKDTDKAWRSGVVLEREGSEALITETFGKQEIVIKVRGKFAKELMTLIAEDFDKMHGSIDGLEVDKKVPCTCRNCKKLKVPHEYSHKELLVRKERNKKTIECKNPEYEDVNVQGLLDGIFTQVDEKEEVMNSEKERPLKVFLSYSHKDMIFKDDLYTHLSMLRNSYKIETWDDGEIIAGQEWNETILNQLRNADVILLLLSSDAIASKYIWEKEIKIALEKREKGNLVIPIYVRSFDFEGLNDSNLELNKLKQAFLTQLQWLPTKDGKLKAVSKWEDKDEALTEVAKEIRKAIENYGRGKG